jgi:hypothetical protein
MPTRPADTTAEAEAVQVGLLRHASVARRLHVAFSLTATVISAARRALGRSWPLLSDRERDLRFVEFHYGADIAEGVRADLERRRRSSESGG